MKSILFASNNPGKLADVRSFASKFGYQIRGPKDYGLEIDVEETGTTFEENALLKLEAYLEAIDDSYTIVMADDSGICIDALDDEPGVKTRRWKGYTMSDDEIVEYCLYRLRDVEPPQRSARFTASIAFAQKGEKPQVVSHDMAGEILTEPDDEGHIEGFPFWRLFYIPEAGRMLHEMRDIPKDFHFLTHRQKALKETFQILKNNPAKNY